MRELDSKKILGEGQAHLTRPTEKGGEAKKTTATGGKKVSTILTDCHNVEDYRDMMATEELYEVNVGDFTVRVRLGAVNRLYLCVVAHIRRVPRLVWTALANSLNN